MKLHLNERGELNVLLVPVILLSLLFVGAGAFGVWAFNSRQDYKNNVDSKVKTAVATNTQTVQAKDAADFADAEKNPLKTYTAPEAYGSVQVQYPKTWSAYVVTDGTNPVDGYFHPDIVPNATDIKSSFALRVEVVSQAYSQVVGQYTASAKTGKVTVAPYTLPRVPKVVGVRVDGQITQNKQGSLVVFPLRDKTLKIWTEDKTFADDFNNNILPNATFSP